MPDNRRAMPDDAGLLVAIRPKLRSPHVDGVLRDLASRQHGVVARRQLSTAGVTDAAVKARVRSGHLLRLHRGVYAVGHRQLRREGHWLAAVLAVGPGAVLSHRDAAAPHAIRPPGAHRRIDVATRAEAMAQPGINIHGTTVLDPEDVTTVNGIPTTAVARTLVDLAAVLPADRVAKAMGEAERLHLLDVRAIERVLERTRGRRGSGHRTMRKALEELQAHGAAFTHSELEDRFLSLVVERHGLPRPLMNAYVADLKVDALWREQRVIVELDGWAFHHTRYAFQSDRERDVRLKLAGYVVVRFTHADVVERPGWVAATVEAMLASSPGATMSRPACP